MDNNNSNEATSAEAILLLLWGIRHQVKEIDGLLRTLIDELSGGDAQKRKDDLP